MQEMQQESRKKGKQEVESRKWEVGKQEGRKVGKQEIRKVKKQESSESSESREIRKVGKYGSREVGKQVVGSRKYEE